MADEGTRRMVKHRIAEFLDVVKRNEPCLVAPADLDGARRHAAAAMLMRAVELLRAAVAADARPESRPAVELTLRSIFEIATRGRFLLRSTDAPDEFVRMCRDAERREGNLAAETGNVYPGLPAWLVAALPPGKAATPRDLWTICRQLDEAEGQSAEDKYSAQAGYRLLYQWLSNSASHAGLAAVKRFTHEIDGVLLIEPGPEPMTTHWPVPIAAAHVGELALAVFEALGVDDADLVATDVRLPRPGELG